MPIILIILGGIAISSCMIYLFYIFFKEDKKKITYTEDEVKELMIKYNEFLWSQERLLSNGTLRIWFSNNKKK